MTDYASAPPAPNIGGSEDATIEAWFTHDDGDRRESLTRARQCAALTKSWLLPREDKGKDTNLPDKFQSMGARGVDNVVGALLMSWYPPDTPWHELVAAPAIRYAQDIPANVLQGIANQLFLRDLMVDSLLESTGIDEPTNRRTLGFRSQKRAAISQFVVTGDALERMNPDYSITVFGRQNYVTCRDCAGNVLYHIARESVDPLSLSPEVLEKSKIDTSKLSKYASARMRWLYSRVEWQPRTKRWVITQELNKQEINESEDVVSPFISTPYELGPEDNYGHGLVEQNVGDLRSLENLRERLLDFAATFSKQVPVIDYDAAFRERDLTKKTGEPIRARVAAGEVQDIAMFGARNTPQFECIVRLSDEVEKKLAKAFLIESEIQPQKERVTALQISRIAQELEGLTGGISTVGSDQNLTPTFARALWQMGRDQLAPPLPPKLVEVKILTGILALRRETDRQRLATIPQLLAVMPDEAKEVIDQRVLVRAYARYTGIYEPGLVRTEEQLAELDRRRVQMEAAMAAANKAVDVAGNVAQNALTPQAQPSLN